MVDMMSEEEFFDIFFCNLIWDSVFVMKFEPMLLVLNCCPNNSTNEEIGEAEEGLIQNTAFFIFKILEVKRNEEESEGKWNYNLLILIQVATMHPVFPFALIKPDVICGRQVCWSVH